MKLIELKNLKKHYNIGQSNEIRANDNINLEIKEGEFAAIVGASGSGKSTLLHMIGCLDYPTSGQIIIDNQDISKLNDSELAKLRLKKIGFVFQTFNLIPGISSLENVTISLMPYGLSHTKEEEAKKLLKELGMEKRIYHNQSKLSGGEKQRVAIARALINNPKIILADEPTGQLDSKTGNEIMDLLKKLNKEKKITIILVTHSESIMKHAKRIIRLKDGKIIEDKKK
ncbi:MAG: ABC transporter ATP-binding protein [Candidatus Nanoarchaeia archaeon]|nr:ABC transporter ATP-binding protein [Candidatus Nanoarchaeia archaeon]MDD5499817.1 ABC transporter ATP-binding protein [Candidatus Nanoarchaeia archaeon]